MEPRVDWRRGTGKHRTASERAAYWRARAASGALLFALLTWMGCSSSEGDSALSAGDGNEGAGARSASASGGSSAAPGPSNGAGGGEPAPLPPEQEKESAFKLPVLSGRWVWAANPQSGRVAVIDTRTLGVQLVQAGFAPTYLAPLPAQGDVLSAALVLNERSHDATLMRLSAPGLTAVNVPTHVGANAWTVSPSGRWAIAWTDASAIQAPDRAESYQDITVIDTLGTTPTATRLSVGYRPSRIFLQQDESRAFVIAEPGISVVELGASGASIERDIALGTSASQPALDVSVVPSGSHALLRREGSAEVGIVDLESGVRTNVTLSGPVTDLDLVADGSAAIAVVRGQLIRENGEAGAAGVASGEGGAAGGGAGSDGSGVGGESTGAAGNTALGGAAGDTAGDGVGGDVSGGTDAGGAAGAGGSGSVPPASGYGPSQVVVLPIPDITRDFTRFDEVLLDDLVGSVTVSADGTRAVLYTTALDLERVVVLSTDPGAADYLQPRSVAVRAPVQAVFVAPDAAHALVSLRLAKDSNLGGAFGIVPLSEALPVKIQTTDAPITGVAFGPAPTLSAILTAATGRTGYLVHLPSLLVDRVALPSLPLAAGIVAEENVGYVVQQHPEGLLSLVDLESGEPRTLTGFELATKVGNGE